MTVSMETLTIQVLLNGKKQALLTLFKLLPLCAAALYSRRLLAGSLGLSSLGGGVVSEGNREHGKSTTPS